MPGRVSTRSTRNSTHNPSSTAAISRKSTASTLGSRASTAPRFSSAPADIPEESPSSALRTQLCSIFVNAQRTTATHRKLVIKLRKIQEECSYEPAGPPGKKGKNENFDESWFNEEVARCVIRLVGVKKAESVGDRVVRFLGLFLKHSSERDHALISEDAVDETDAFPETPSSRLTSYILSLLLPLLGAKEKTVRYRSTQLVSNTINSLDSIDDDLFQLLRHSLLKRVRDKESMVRVQAVIGLGRLAGNETEADQNEDDSDDEDAGGLLDRLLEVLQNDPSADVRRTLLLNLPLTPATLPYLLERARDQDPLTRRALYSRLLPALGDFRHLSLSMREKLLRWGLRDRDESVRKAAARLFRERWIEDCARPRAAVEGALPDEATPPSIDGLLELLERIDVVNSGVENGVALEAMKGFWEGRPDYCEAVTFDDSFWDGLSAESVFMARSFHEFCRYEGDGKWDALVEEKMPEVTKLAFFLEKYLNKLIHTIKNTPEGEGEEDIVEQEFIVEQLLHIAQTLDYTDEVGRRKTFSLLREILATAELPEEITKLVIEVLRGVCGKDASGEREFCGVVLEAVAEVHDTILGDEAPEDESFHSAKSELSEDTPTKARMNRAKSQDAGDAADGEEDEEKAIREIMVNMKCLHIAQCMLENVEGNLQENSHLVTMLNNLVVPAVRSHEAPIRERGLLCLGLCCLLDKTLAEENLTLFLHCFNKGHDALQVYALHILSDILTTHGSALLDSANFENGKPIYKLYTKALKADDRPEAQSAACTAVCKLMLGCVIKDEDLLKTLVVAYFDPSTAENLGLRQALTYFLPVYCHSRKENQERMQRVAVPVMHSLIQINDDLDEEEEMVGLTVIAAHLADWTDPRKLVVAGTPAGESLFDESGRKDAAKAVPGDIHLDLAKDVLEKMFSSGCSKDERKVFTSMLGKMHISPNSTADKLRAVHELVTQAIDNHLVSDAPGRNALSKLQIALGKIVEDSEETHKDTTTVLEAGPTLFEQGDEREDEDEEEGMTVGVGDGAAGALDGEADPEGHLTTQELEGAKDSLLDDLLDDDDDDQEGADED
ncbi:MAG: hypothetical protein M1837_004213 [Sclerophora amabilis]|nr:MAG: hypothetical protein M1837_004213 [Sclerophora amabilis]